MIKKTVIRNSLRHATLRISDDRFFCHYLSDDEVSILITYTYYAILLPELNRYTYNKRITYICTILAK